MTKKPYPSQVAEQFLVRFPDGMRSRIAEAAKENGRSMNAEIIARLERTFADQEASAPPTRAEVQQLLESVKEVLAVEYSKSMEKLQAVLERNLGRDNKAD